MRERARGRLERGGARPARARRPEEPEHARQGDGAEQACPGRGGARGCDPETRRLVTPPTVSGFATARLGRWEVGVPWPHPQLRLWRVGAELSRGHREVEPVFAGPGVLGPQRSLLTLLGNAWFPWGAPCTCPQGVAGQAPAPPNS